MTERHAGVAVQVVRAFPDRADVLDLRLHDGAHVADALAAAQAAGWDTSEAEVTGIAVYGRLVDVAQGLRDGDRVELLRPLVADPKQQRRARAVPPRGRRAP